MTATFKLASISAVAALGLGTAAQAVVIANFNFNDLPSTGQVPNLILASDGVGTLNLGGFNGGQVSFTGTTVNALPGDVAGRDLALQNGTGAADPVSGAGGFIDFTFSTLLLENINVSFARQRSGTGFLTNTFSFSNNGGATFTTAATQTIGVSGTATTFAGTGVQTLDLSSFSGIENQSAVILRLTLSDPASLTGASGNNRFDNFRIEGTLIPEPASLSLLALGGLALVRRRRA